MEASSPAKSQHQWNPLTSPQAMAALLRTDGVLAEFDRQTFLGGLSRLPETSRFTLRV